MRTTSGVPFFEQVGILLLICGEGLKMVGMIAGRRNLDLIGDKPKKLVLNSIQISSMSDFNKLDQ